MILIIISSIYQVFHVIMPKELRDLQMLQHNKDLSAWAALWRTKSRSWYDCWSDLISLDLYIDESLSSISRDHVFNLKSLITLHSSIESNPIYEWANTLWSKLIAELVHSQRSASIERVLVREHGYYLLINRILITFVYLGYCAH